MIIRINDEEKIKSVHSLLLCSGTKEDRDHLQISDKIEKINKDMNE